MAFLLACSFSFCMGFFFAAACAERRIHEAQADAAQAREWIDKVCEAFDEVEGLV